MNDFAPQGSGEWLRARIGCLTASRMAAAVAFTKDGKDKAERRNLKIEILTERMADAAVDHVVTPAMKWGLEWEATAKQVFEEEAGLAVMPAGFIEHPSIPYFGASPDGLIGRHELIEVKCPTSTTHIGWILGGEVPEEYKPQMLAQLACTRRTRCHFVSYDPRMPHAKRLFMRPFEPTAKEIAAIEKAAVDFLAEVDRLFDELVTAK